MKRSRRRGRACPPAALLCALLILLLEAPQLRPETPFDVPAAGDFVSCPHPEEEPALAESSPPVQLPEKAPEPEVSAAVLPVRPPRGQAGTAVYFKNQTDYPIDMEEVLRVPCPVKLGQEGVQVLIMHTHATEAYTPSPGHEYKASGNYRTTDPECSVLRVGRQITEALNARGISTVQSTTLNDYPAYNGCYTRALKDIRRYTEQYPSLQLVIDVHRDAIVSGDTYYKTSAEIGGKQTAQLMMVTGTDAGGLQHDHWRQNLAFQARLHALLNGRHPGLMRPMTIRKGRFNQHVRRGSMLIEVGACGNTLEEALAAADAFAEGLADLLLSENPG